MKKLLLTILCAFVLLGCRKEISIVSIEISSYSAEFPAKGGPGSISFELTGPFEGVVKAESSENWLTILETTNSGASYVLGPNDEFEPRTAVITVSAGDISRSVTVSQEAALQDIPDKGDEIQKPVEFLSHSSFGCDADGCASETVSLTDYAEEQWGDWNYEKEGDWFEVTRNGNQFTISVQENTTGDDRRGCVFIKSTDGTVLLAFDIVQTHFSYDDLIGHYVLKFGAEDYWVMDFIKDEVGFAVKAVGTTASLRKTENHSLKFNYVGSGDNAPKMMLKLPQMLGTVDDQRLMLYATDQEGYYSVSENLGYELVYTGTTERMCFDFVTEKDVYWKGFPSGFSGLFLMKGLYCEDWIEPSDENTALQIVKWREGSHDGF